MQTSKRTHQDRRYHQQLPRLLDLLLGLDLVEGMLLELYFRLSLSTLLKSHNVYRTGKVYY